MVSIVDFLVQDHLADEYDTSCLHRPLFDVNIRLYKGNQNYRDIVIDIISYMKRMFDMKFSDYGKVKGVSGANIGIPFNIIIVSDKNKLLIVMINPEIIEASAEKSVKISNCGSLRLKDPINVLRHNGINVTFFDEIGNKITKTFTDRVASTIQHEIDHNNGVTIEDREHSKDN